MSESMFNVISEFEPVLHNGHIVRFGKPPSGEAVACLGPVCAELLCEGPDTCEFISRITSLTPQHLKNGEHQLGFILEHNGKIKVSFDLLKHDNHRVSLFCSPEERDTLFNALDMYHFAEALTLSDGAHQYYMVVFDRDHQLLNAVKTQLTLKAWRSNPDVEIRVYQKEHFIQALETVLKQGGRIDGIEAFEKLRIGLGTGNWLTEFTSSVTPLDVNALAGIVQQKGCYPGQEVIERTLAIGRPARRLVMVVGPQFNLGEEVFDTEGHVVGLISSVIEFNETSMCGLAIVKGRISADNTYKTETGSLVLRDF
ncbi:MAG: hypothetical protein ACPGQS_09215 [Bradymonadia bacterium]